MASGAELWDSGRVESASSVDVAYAGRPLPPAAECEWAVQVWDEAGAASEWSEPARFRTGLAGWSAQWIGRDRVHDPADAPRRVTTSDPDRRPAHAARVPVPAPVVREPRRAAAGDALRHRARRGRAGAQRHARRRRRARAGLDGLPKRIEYAAHDVTELVRDGENVLGAILGDGWYAGYVGFDPQRRGNHYGRDPALLCELHLEHADGSVEVIASDAEWRGHDRADRVLGPADGRALRRPPRARPVGRPVTTAPRRRACRSSPSARSRCA